MDISKAVDKVWHPGLLYKLNQNGILGNLLETLTDFLKDQRQRVVLDGQNSLWANVETAVLRGSIVGPLLFLIYINSLSDNLSTNVRLFADDTSLFFCSAWFYFFLQLEYWFKLSSKKKKKERKNARFSGKWALILNLQNKFKKSYLLRSFMKKITHPPPCLYFNDTSVKVICKWKHLGMLSDFKLHFQEHWKSLLKRK